MMSLYRTICIPVAMQQVEETIKNLCAVYIFRRFRFRKKKSKKKNRRKAREEEIFRRLTEILRYCEITGKGIDERKKMR